MVIIWLTHNYFVSKVNPWAVENVKSNKTVKLPININEISIQLINIPSYRNL